MKQISLQNRLLLTATILLVFFLGMTGLALDKAFQSSAESAEMAKLESELYVLLGAAELNQYGSLDMPEVLAEPRFSVPESGLVAQIITAEGTVSWVSTSALGLYCRHSMVYRSINPASSVYRLVERAGLAIAMVWPGSMQQNGSIAIVSG